MASAAHELHLRHVATFVAVVETGSFRNAAEYMNISQSAVSVRIQQIELRLGVPVLHRTTRHVEPTSEGLRFFAVAKSALKEMERIAAELRKEAFLHQGLVAAAAMPSVSVTLMPVVIAALAEEYPDLRLQQNDVDSSRILQLVKNGDVDFGLTTELDDKSNFEFTPLFFEECVLVLRRDDPAPEREKVTFARSLEWPILVSPNGVRLRDVIDKAYEDAGFILRPAQEAWQMLTLERLVAAGVGAAVMPLGPATRADPAHFRLLHFDKPFGRTVGLLRARNRSQSPAARAVHTFLVKNIEDLMSRAGLSQYKIDAGGNK